MISYILKLWYLVRHRGVNRKLSMADHKRDNSDRSLDEKYAFVVILTQFKRSNLKLQLQAIQRQTLAPDAIFVVQNGSYIDITEERNHYQFHHIHNHYNTKYFGRFSFCLGISADQVIVMDDDIIPGERCFEHYLSELQRLNGIIGGNGRLSVLNANREQLKTPPDTGVRDTSVLVDFVGHLWCFKHEWLRAMFSIKPHTLDTGEDMHFCFSAKEVLNVPSYTASQSSRAQMCDTSENVLGTDQYASFKKTPDANRVAVEKYFLERGLIFVEKN